MTSTSFNVGLNTGARNSSKVLKPPGGGSSDIFGAASSEPSESQRKTRNHMSSSIFSEETNTSSIKAECKAVTVGDGCKTETPVINGASSSTSSTISTPAPTPSAPAPTAANKRVPPGGFSSGLW